MLIKRKITALYLGEGIIRYTVQNKFKWWQRWHYMMDGNYPRLFSAEELQLLGIKKIRSPMEIKELLIGQWPDMNFRVGETNRIYGECNSIKSSWNLTKQSSEGRGEWNDSEYTATYDVECIKDGVTRQISFNQDHPDIVVVMQK